MTGSLLTPSPSNGSGAAAVSTPPGTLGGALRETALHTLVYGVGYLLMKMTEVILIPLYTHMLLPADYGVLAMAFVAVSLASSIFGLGLGSALFRSYYDYTDEENRCTVVVTALTLTTISSAMLVLIGWLASPWLATLLFNDRARTSYVLFLCGIAGLELLQGMPLAIYRARKMSRTYSILNGVLLLIRLGLIVWLVAVARLGVYGVLLGMLAGHAVSVVVLFAGVMNALRPTFSWIEVKKLLAYGTPLVVVSLAMLVVSISDRFFLKHFRDFAEVGVYNLGYQLGAAVSVLLVGPFKLVWPAMMCSMEAQPHAAKYFARMLTYFTYFGLIVVLAVSIPAREIVAVVATEEYGAAARVVPLIALSYMMMGVWSVANVGLALKRKTLQGSGAAVIAAVANIVLNAILIPPFGMVGAAIATLVSYVLLCGVSFWMSDRYYSVRYEWSRLARLAAAAAVVFIVGRAIDTPLMWLSVLVKIALVGCFPIVLVPLGFYAGELQHARHAVRRWALGHD